MTNVIKYITKQ